MVMSIKFENVIVNDEKCAKIVNFRVLDKGDLTADYIDTKVLPMCFSYQVFSQPALFVQDANGIKCLKYQNYLVGDVVSLEERQWIISTMGAAGRRLFRMNKQKREELEAWIGKVEVVKF